MGEAHVVQLVEQCKTETKKLLELAVTNRKVHWAHPTFTSFLASVESVLSYKLSESSHEARAIYDKCFTESDEGRESYACVHTRHLLGRRVLWVRVALLEGALTGIIECLMSSPRLYYRKGSVLTHPECGGIFQTLLDGPCSIQYWLRVWETVSPLTISKLVDRHTRMLSVSVERHEKTMATNMAWMHVQNLYGSSSSVCLYGKNNVLAKPAGLSSPLRGYLTLQLTRARAELKLSWIPNCLLNDSTHIKTGLWDDVIAVDMLREVSHIHCHRARGSPAEMILIGYDGFAHPPMTFPYQPSLFVFLECLVECHPLLTLHPPLTHSQHTHLSRIRTWFRRKSRRPPLMINKAWPSQADAWSLVFRVHSNDPPTPPPSHGTHHNDLPEEDRHVTMDTSPSTDWEEAQVQVARQLLASHFRSWHSHCERVGKARRSLSHVISSTHVSDASKRENPLSEREWLEFCQLSPVERERKWSEVLSIIYLRGVEHCLRPQVWPVLLGVWPVSASTEEREEIFSNVRESYCELLGAWQRSEVIHKMFVFCSSARSPPLLSSPTPSSHHHSNSDITSASNAKIARLPTHSEDHVITRSKSCDSICATNELDERDWLLIREKESLDKDIPRCDRDHPYYESGDNLLTVRNIVCTYVSTHLSEGYSQGMCDLLAPILVVIDNETLAYACYGSMMERASKLFPPSTEVDHRLEDLRTLLQVLEPEFHQYLTEQSRDGLDLLYCYRWFLVSFKREFCYEDLFRLWESLWAARLIVSEYFELFLALAVMRQYQAAIMDAHLTSSDTLNLFTNKADRQEIDCVETLRIAVLMVEKLQELMS